MIPRLTTLALLSALMVTLPACVSSVSGTALAGPPSSLPSQATAPKVAHPLDASAFLAKPCTALTSSDTAALGLPGAQPDDNSDNLGPGCSFGVGLTSVGIAWETIDADGLSAVYQLRSRHEYWIPKTIEGYPAVEASSVDRRASGSCQINVGVNDQLFFFADSEGTKDANAACSMAEHAAAAAVRNLKAIQGGK